ncbi:MAG TPA: hypothetical protein VMY76_12865 [Gemmatimonadales bacterium]|nr:hypothetical protein [Gemmatimonadales bacterium]
MNDRKREAEGSRPRGHKDPTRLPSDQLIDPKMEAEQTEPHNERNLQALQLLVDDMQLIRSSFVSAREAAKWLAARGVLVPAALTDDEAVKIGADAVGAVPTDPAEIALCVRQGLERIARGER